MQKTDATICCRPPDKIASIIGLKSKKCVPCEAGAKPLTDAEIELLRRQVRVAARSKSRLYLRLDRDLLAVTLTTMSRACPAQCFGVYADGPPSTADNVSAPRSGTPCAAR